MVDLSYVPEAIETLKQVADVDFIKPDRQVLLDTIDQYDAYWGHVEIKMDKAVLDRAKRLKVLNTASTGTDHIDKEEAARRGIRVLSITRDYELLDTFTATAECAWMLMLGCHRHLRSATTYALDGNWQGQRFVGKQLSQATLGVLGVGRLGKMTVEFGKGFRMRVIGCDLKPFDIPGVEPVDAL